MRARWCLVGLIGVVAGGLGPAVARAAVVPPTPASSWQTDGRVRALAVVGGKVFLGGDFTHVRPPGATSGGVVREHLAAFSLTTGNLLPWNPGADGSVLALRVSPDGKTVYIGGSFAHVGGVARANVAAVSTKHVVVRKWRAHTNGRVDALLVTGTEVFMGGAFSHVDGHARAALAAVGVGASAPLRTWAPRANALVRALSLSPGGGRVFAGGDFTSVNGHTSADHLAALAVTNGAVTKFGAHPPWTVTSLRTSPTRLYAGGSGNGGHLNSYDARSGARRWSVLTDGAVETLVVRLGVIYVGGRFANYCKGGTGGGTPFACTTPILRVHLLALSTSGGGLVRWTPGANSTKGVSATSASSGGLQVGGDFTKIGGKDQQGFARFG